MQPRADESDRVLLRVLGPLHAERGGHSVPLAPAERAVLARLALDAPRPVSADRLAAAIWPGQLPDSARASLHNHLARLRSKLGADAVERVDERYRLGPSVQLDSDLLLAGLEQAERLLSSAEPEKACVEAELALSLSNGPPYEDLVSPESRTAAERVTDIVASLEDVQAAALLALSRSGTALALLQRLVERQPTRERRWALLVRALHEQGRRGEALAAFSRARRELGARTGLRPGSELAAAAQAVLDDAPPGAAGADEASLPVRSTRLVGRDAVLDQLVGRVQAGNRLLALVGAPGSGSSSLAVALAHRVTREFPFAEAVVRTACEAAPDVALQPLVDVAEALRDRLGPQRYARVAGRDGALLDPSAPRTAPLYGPADVPGRLVRTLDRLSREVGGLVLVVDDAHLAGPTTASVLLRLTQQNLATVVLTAPDLDALPVDLLAAGVEPVGGLSPEDLQVLVASLLDRDEGDVAELSTWVHEQCSGLPGSARALLAALLAERLVSVSTPGPITVPRTAGVPARLADQLRQRLASLDPGALRALEAAVVLEGESSGLLLLHLCSPSDLTAAHSAGLLPASGLVRRVLVAELAPGRRLELLAAAGAAAEQAALSPQVVAHYRLAAAELDPVAAVDAARAAGDDALAQAAFGEAAGWYERALAVLAGLGGPVELARLELVVRRGDAHRLSGVVGHAEELLDAAEMALVLAVPTHAELDRVIDLRRRAALAVAQLGGTSEAGHENTRAAAVADRALAAESDPEVRAVLSAAASMVHSMGERPRRCLELYLAAERDSRHLDARDPVAGRTRRQVLPFAYLALGHPDDLPERISAADELLAGAVAAEDPVAEFEGWHLTASVAMLTADGPRLRRAHVRLGELADVVGDVGRRWSWHYTDAALAHLSGRLEQAETLSETAMAVGAGITASRALAAYGSQLLDLRRAQGRLGELAGLFEDLVRDQPSVHAWHAAAALARTAPGDLHSLDAAREHLDALLSGGPDVLPRDFTLLATLVCAGRAAAAIGASSRADAQRVGLLRARLAPYDHLTAWQGACTYGPVALVSALLAQACGDVSGARESACRARDLAECLGADLWVLEADELLDTLTPA